MKYIKKFNENNSIDNILIDIKDMFLEEIDLGYSVRLGNPNSKYCIDDNLVGGRKQIGDIDVHISKLKENHTNTFITLPFTTSDISESLDRLINYMEDLDYDYKMYGEYYELEAKPLNTNSDDKIKNLHIRFRKAQ